MPRERARPSFSTWRGVAFRATSYDVPLWVNPNRRSGRWNIAGQGCTQYLALDAEAPIAELLRHEDIRDESLAAHYSTGLWQLKVDLGAVVDYSTFDTAEQAGFPPDALVEDDHERCQVEARRLMDMGAVGLLSLSAALPGSVNLTIFGPRVPVPWNTTARLASAIPAQRLTTGHPPEGLTKRVRYFGEQHALLASYRLSR
jgi:hypothetical protein